MRIRGRKTFLLLDEGELEGNFGYWAEDQMVQKVLWMPWIWDDHDYSWYQT